MTQHFIEFSRNKFRFLLRAIVLSVLIFSIEKQALAQVFVKSKAEAVVPGSEKVLLNKDNKTIKYVKFNSRSLTKANDQKAFLKKVLPLKAGFDFSEKSTAKDKKGYLHKKFQLVYKNIPVEFMIYNVHSVNGAIESINGDYVLDEPSANIASIAEEKAFEIAKSEIKAEKYRWENLKAPRPKGELVYLPVNGKLVLAYKFDIYATKPISRNYIYVDAASSKVLKKINRIQNSDATGTAETRYSGTVSLTTDYTGSNYRLREAARGQGIETYDLNQSEWYDNAADFTDADNYWNTSANYDDAAYDAHYNTEKTYDYYLERFNRSSFDGNGAKMLSYVHYGSNYVNAFWDGERMTYGDGDGTSYYPLTATEVVGHEITHGVTERTAGLIYSSESGALNESFSDIFGVAIDFYANPGTANWEMGDAMSVTHQGFRSMSDPNKYGCPDTYKGDYWDPWEEVHTNSGVQNFWFYLLCEGGSGVNDLGNSYTVSSIGMEKATEIAYRNLAFYLSPSSNHEEARFYSIQAAIDIYGECSPEVIAVTNAWYAVGVGEQFDGKVIADFDVVETNYCATPASVQFINKSIQAQGYLWDFGDGTSDTATNPLHLYQDYGQFNVSLKVSGAAACSENGDSITKIKFINVSEKPLPAQTCTPVPGDSGFAIVRAFNLNNLNYAPKNPDHYYHDFTCTKLDTLQEGKAYDITISSYSYKPVSAKIWIDLNNDGSFNNNEEQLIVLDNIVGNYNGKIIIPKGAIYGSLLRIRVVTDYTSNAFTDACYSPISGQVLDFSVIVSTNEASPLTDFKAVATKINPGQSIQFKDLSQNTPTQWHWYFEGGNPAESTEQNPTVVFNSIGNYTVSLVTSNNSGTDSIAKQGYIYVNNDVPALLNATLKNRLEGLVSLSWTDGKQFSLNEDFEDGIADNFAFTDEHITIENGLLQIQGSGNDLMPRAIYQSEISNFILETKFKFQGYGASAVIFFRGSELNGNSYSGYALVIDPKGEFAIYSLSGGYGYQVVGWTQSTAINTGEGVDNIINLAMSGENGSLFINGQFVTDFTDKNYSKGQIALAGILDDYNFSGVSYDYAVACEGAANFRNLAIKKAENKLIGGGDMFNAPKIENKNYVGVHSLINQIVKVSKSLEKYNIYRNNVVVASTANTSYIDTLPAYGYYTYSVSAVYPEGESDKTDSVSVYYEEPLAGDKCDNAMDLALLNSPYSGTTIGYDSDFSTCYMGDSPDRIFYIDVLPGDTLIIGQTDNNYDSYTSLTVGGNCPGNETLYCNDDPDIQIFTYANLTSDKQRVYWIQAGFGSGSGDFTLAWNLIHTSCPKPTQLKTSEISFNSAIVSWIKGFEENSWQIEWGNKGFTPGSGKTEVVTDSSIYYLNGLKASTSYDFYVKALCDSSDESRLVKLNFTTKTLPVPTDLKVVLTDADSGKVELSWIEGQHNNNDSIEDFEDGIADNWVPIYGNWSVSNGTYNNYASTISSSAYNQFFNSFSFEASVRSIGSSFNGLIFNGDPGKLDEYNDWYNSIMYTFDNSGTIYLVANEEGEWNSLASFTCKDLNLSDSAWNTLKVVYSNGNIDIYVNSVYEGTYFTNYNISGKLGLHAGGYASFDNVIISDVPKGYKFGKPAPNATIAKVNGLYSGKLTVLSTKSVKITPVIPVKTLADSAVYYRIYKNDQLVDSTTSTLYKDVLNSFGSFGYQVTAVYPEGESALSKQAFLSWFGNPIVGISNKEYKDTLALGDSIQHNLTITNDGNGLLIFNIKSNTVNNTDSSIRKSVSGKNTTSYFQPRKSVSQHNFVEGQKNALVIRDQYAWGFNSNVAILENMGVNVSTAASYELQYTNFENYDLVVIESEQEYSFYDSLSSYYNKFEDYVKQGGILEAHLAESCEYPNFKLPNGLMTSYWNNLNNYNYVADSVHPICANVPMVIYHGLASHDEFETIPENASILVVNEIGKPTVVEYSYGSGRIIATTMTWEHMYGLGNQAGILLPNALEYAISGEKITPWLYTTNTSDTLSAGESVNLDVFINSKNLHAQDYFGNVEISSTDIKNPLINIPVSLSVISEPLANFNIKAKVASKNANISIENLSTGNPTSYLWYFPGADVEYSTDKNPVVSYSQTGTYSVQLIVSNKLGADTLLQDNAIEIVESLDGDNCSNAINLADFWYYFNGSTVGMVSDFKLYDANGPDQILYIDVPAKYSLSIIFDWADYNAVYSMRKGNNCPGDSVIISAFPGYGNFYSNISNNTERIYLVVSGGHGESGNYSLTYQLNEIPKPVASFYSNYTNILTGSYIDFYNYSLNATEYEWHFEGAVPSTSTEDSIVWGVYYPNEGTYDVTLIAKSQIGADTLVMTDYINVSSAPAPYNLSAVVNFEGYVNLNWSSGYWPDYYKIYRNNEYIGYSYGSSYYDYLSQEGDYEYYVTAVYNGKESEPSNIAKVHFGQIDGGDNCSDALDLSKISKPLMGTTVGYKADFDFCNMGSAPDRIFYLDLPAGAFLYIHQTYNDYDSKHSLRVGGSCPGDKEIVCTDDPDYEGVYYSNTSNKTERVYWIQSGYSGGSGNFVLDWEVYGSINPVASFTASSTVITPNDSVIFYNESSNAKMYRWNFEGGNPSNSNEAQPVVYYEKEGDYDVSLVVYGDSLATDTMVLKDYIHVDATPAPYDLTGRITNDVEGSVAVAWSSAGKPLYYNVYRNGMLLDSTKVEYLIDTIPAYGNYQYKVSAVYSSGESELSAPFNIVWSERDAGEDCSHALSLADLYSPFNGSTNYSKSDFNLCDNGTAPDKIFYVDVPHGNTVSIGQNWNDYDSYIAVKIGNDCSSAQSVVCMDEPDDYHYVYENNTGETKRIWYIQSGYNGHSGNFSLDWSLTSAACAIPYQLTSTILNDSTAELSWKAVEGQTNWEVELLEVGQTPTGNPNYYADSTILKIENLQPGKMYQYFVRSNCADVNSAWAGPTIFRTSLEKAEWTWMLYLYEDGTGLNGFDDFNELEANGSTDKVNYLVLYDSDDDNRDGIYLVSKDENGYNSNLVSPIISKHLNANLNMNNWETLSDFMVWSQSNFPANHYGVTVWDHGSGIFFNKPKNTINKGVVGDMKLWEMDRALKNFAEKSGSRMDIVGTDVCLMGQLETAYQFKDYSDYLIASEMTEPGDGWDYVAAFEGLNENPSITPVALAQNIVNTYVDSYKPEGSQGENSVTQAAIDLRGLDSLFIPQFNTFSINLSKFLSRYKNEIKKCRDNAYASPDGYNYDHKDLGDFLRLLSENTSLPLTLRNSAGSLLNTYSTIVVANGFNGQENAFATGMKVWMTEQISMEQDAEKYLNSEQYLKISNTAWDEYLKIYEFPESAIPEFAANKATLCNSETVTFSDMSSGYITSYFWNFGEGATPANASGKGPHIVSYTGAGKKNVSLTLNSSYVNEKDGLVEVFVPVFLTDSVEICEGESYHGHSAAETFTETYNCDSVVTTVLQVNDNPYVIASSDQSICAGDSVIIEANGIGAISIDAFQQNSIKVAPENSQIYVAQASTECGIAKDSVAITVKPIPATPVLRQDGKVLVSSASSGNQWYEKDSGIINLVTQNQYQPQVNGNYFVVVTLDGCVSDSSNIIHYLIDEIPGLSLGIRAYPVPVVSDLKVESHQLISSIEITGLLGNRIMVVKDLNSKTAHIDMNSFKPGTYLLKVSHVGESKIHIQKITKM